MLQHWILERLVRDGGVVVIDSEGRAHHAPGHERAPLVVRLKDASLGWKVLEDPGLVLGEAYMDGRVVIEQGSIYDLLELGARQMFAAAGNGVPLPRRVAGWIGRRLHQWNPAGRARRNVAHHYDLSGELYRLFLDSDRQYSCAYFASPGMTLEEAQHAKKRHLAAKLLLRPGQRVLDIGSGWGGLGLYLARIAGCDVTGLTLSEEQLKESNARAAAAGLAERVRFRLEDYRATTGSFDRIVSVGMFEHVGVNHYGTFFRKVRDLLKPDGVAVLHAIGRAHGPWYTHPFIRKYIFPGGHLPALSEVLPAIERAGLWVTDVEILRLHYAETLRAWRQRFLASRDKAKALYDERFCRMWEFYLAACEVFFREQDGMVFQIQLARSRDAVPLTRDYIHAFEQRMAAEETMTTQAA
ncbi:class I SAM-dependent methyltransferase [Benzoatithermus flavus]|uniref:Cyclopropane-fatty-acyl-phospholipid synthase family protein n=1 Tax=Benzoatithermus flavus TaxID=3108223 RepID=A0ABU8XPQ5_9PROT